MVNIAFLLNSALSCNKRWLESLAAFFKTEFGISWGVPGIWFLKKTLHLSHLTAKQYQKLNDEKKRCVCLPHTLWSLFSLNVHHVGVCAAETCVGGCWCPAGTTSSLCIHCPTVHVGGQRCQAQAGLLEQSVAQRQDLGEHWGRWADSTAGVTRSREGCASGPVGPEDTCQPSRRQAVLSVTLAVFCNITCN